MRKIKSLYFLKSPLKLFLVCDILKSEIQTAKGRSLMIKRIACLLLAVILLGAAAGLPASELFAAAADGTEAFADLANRIRSTGEPSGSGYLLSYDLDAESRELFAAVYRPEQSVIELSVTYDGYMCASLTIPAALSTLYKVTSSFQSAGGSARGTAWLDPAAYTGAEPPALSDYTGDEGFRQGVISILRRFLPHLVEEIGVLLWADGHLLSELGFTGFTVHTKHLFRTEPDPDEPPTCTEDGFLRRTCVVCGTVSRDLLASDTRIANSLIPNPLTASSRTTTICSRS
jgi:hypothetical protein